MSIQYFYNFILKGIDPTDLSGDLLSGIRKSFFEGNPKVRDRISANSDAQPYFCDFSIEKEKPMKWTVKSASGKTEQEVMLSDSGKYYLYFYKMEKLYKRMLFSRRHTLLKVEYFDADSGTAVFTLEPRKAQNGLCILFTDKARSLSVPLFEAPEIGNAPIRERMQSEFTDYTVEASTNEGIVRFLSDEQLLLFRLFREKCEQEAALVQEESFVGGDTPLLDKIKAKDFNVKRNLSSSLDITHAMEFGTHDAAEESPAEPITIEETASAQTEIIEADAETIADDQEINAVPVEDSTIIAEEPAAQADTDTEAAPAENETLVEEAAPETLSEPDKRIMADGAVYSYYGELDAQGNRSGYGRTLTELGRTAYEGHYRNDKRSGNGSYFYKNGMLCYTGDWLENVRHGVGVGVSSRDGSIHVGSWKNNKPEGSGVRLTSEGDIKFVCKELGDGTTVLMNYLPDDTVVITKYDESGTKIGETTMSLKDLPL